MRVWDYWSEMSYRKYLYISNHNRLRQEADDDNDETENDEEEDIGDIE